MAQVVKCRHLRPHPPTPCPFGPLWPVAVGEAAQLPCFCQLLHSEGQSCYPEENSVLFTCYRLLQKKRKAPAFVSVCGVIKHILRPTTFFAFGFSPFPRVLMISTSFLFAASINCFSASSTGLHMRNQLHYNIWYTWAHALLGQDTTRLCLRYTVPFELGAFCLLTFSALCKFSASLKVIWAYSQNASVNSW